MNELSLPQRAKTLEEFAAACRRIRHFNREYKWRLGEWLVLHEEMFGDRIYQYCDDLAMSKQDVLNCMSIYRRIGNQWTPEIGWSLWQALAPLEPEQREPFIERAKNNAGGISRDEIRRFVAASRNGNGLTSHEISPSNPLIDALLTVGKLLSREAKGEDVTELLRPALDELIAEAMAKLARISRESAAEV